MSDQVSIDKQIATITKGNDKKGDALMLMSPDCNWGQFLSPAPYAVAILGELLLVSADTDFSLEGKPPKDGFQYIKYPNSFRASLVQVSNTGWENFNLAHGNMNQIQLQCGNVDAHVKTAVKFLLRGTPDEVRVMLPMSLNKIQRIADECLLLSSAVEGEFVDMMSLISELLEASTNTKGVYEEKKQETETAIEVAKVQKHRLLEDVEDSEKRLKRMDEEVVDAQKQFKEAIDSIPSGGNLLGLQLGEAFLGTIKNILHVGTALVKKGVEEKTGIKLPNEEKADQKPKQTTTGLNVELSKQAIFKQAGSINMQISALCELMKGGTGKDKKPCPDWKRIQNGDALFIYKLLGAIKSSVDKETESGQLHIRTAQLCSDSMTICNKLIEMSDSLSVQPELFATLIPKVDLLQKNAQILQMEAIKELGVNPLDRKPYYLSTMEPDGTSASQEAVANARYKTETAKETLRDAKRRQEKTTEQLQEMNKRLTEVLMNMAKLHIDEVDFDTIRAILIKGINALAELREQWSKLVRFFQMLSNIIKCCLHTSLTGFVDEAKSGRELKLGNKTYQLSAIFRDVLFEHASKCSELAFIVYTISSTYVKISDKYIMDKVTTLGRLITLDPKQDQQKIMTEKNKLFTGCKEAQQYIQAIVMEEKTDFNEKIGNRLAQIKKLEKELPAPDTHTLEDIKDSVKKGFSPEGHNLGTDDDDHDDVDDKDLDDLI